MRIVFLGSPTFAVPSLERLVRDGYEVVAAFTQPDRPAGRGRTKVPPPVKQAALRLGLPVYQPESLKAPEAFHQLAGCRPDVIVVCAYGQILSQDVIDLPQHQCLNVHFSLLPRHRGATPAAAAILAGDAFTGVTIQLVRKKLDSGPLLAAASIPVADDDTTGRLAWKLSIVGAGLISESLGGWLRGEREPRLQDDTLSTYISQIKKEDGRIDWTETAEKIWRKVRAYQPWPGSFTTWQGKQVKITAAAVSAMPADKPGAVTKLPDGNIGIGTGEGTLSVKQLQLEGKKEMDAGAFLRGNGGIIGAVLPD